jgi:hypothetical protein
MDFVFPCPYCGNSVIVPDNLRSQPSEPEELKPDTSNYVNESAIFQKLQELLKAGKKSEAVQLYRYCYSDGLTSAKKVVNEIEAGTVTELPKNQIDPSILNIYSSKADDEKTSRKGNGYLFLISVVVVVLLGLMVLGLIAVFNPGQSKSSAIPATSRPTSMPLATKVPEPTELPDFGTLLLRFGGEGAGPGKFKRANDIALAPDGLIYVGDADLYRIEMFDATGKFITQWVLDPDDHYRCLAADGASSLYVNEGGRIYRYDRQTGKRIGEIKYTDEGGFQEGFGSMAALPNGGLAATWINRNLETDDILIFDSGGNLVNKITKAVTGPADSGQEYDIELAVDGVGDIYGLGVSAQTVVKYSPKGKFLTRFGSRGSLPGQFGSETHIAINSQGMVFVFGNNNIIFDSDGLFIKTFNIKGHTYGYGYIFDLDDNLYFSGGVEVVKYVLSPAQ